MAKLEIAIDRLSPYVGHIVRDRSTGWYAVLDDGSFCLVVPPPGSTLRRGARITHTADPAAWLELATRLLVSPPRSAVAAIALPPLR